MKKKPEPGIYFPDGKRVRVLHRINLPVCILLMSLLNLPAGIYLYGQDRNLAVNQPSAGMFYSDDGPPSAYLSQQRVISGRITDAATGEELPGASIIIRGTTIGTTSGVDGGYSLSVPGPDAVLAVSFIGYLSREIPVGDNTVINVTLEEDVRLLEEIVVVGYGSMRRENLTGAVDQVTGQAFENRPVTNLTQGLQGVMPNVNIRLLDGKPTQSPRINIRGTTSIGQGGEALILIDGVEGDPSMLNPNDIESISVLKDASSSAIYGARGAFGVVLITTRKPQTDVFSVTYSTNLGMKQPIALPNYVTDGYTWATHVQ
jgi:TonB-dependent SusC/RagA subfamily outer membrane receptor